MPFCLCHSWGSMPAVLEKWKELSSHWVFTRVREIYTSFSKPLQASHSPDFPFIYFFDRLLFAPIGSAVCQLECSLNLIVFINAQGTRLLMSSQLPCQWNAESPGNAALPGSCEAGQTVTVAWAFLGSSKACPLLRWLPGWWLSQLLLWSWEGGKQSGPS